MTNLIKLMVPTQCFLRYIKKKIPLYPALAATLRRISKNGRDEFYKGETAKTLVRYLQKGAIITMEDLAQYEAQWRTPLSFKYKDLNIISMAPPSSGGICLAQIFEMIT
jgi:gamma-glutamyltranspeptidase/glutathione hydrolase